jgi:DNA-binding NarL/FixJ family response regulator
MNSRLKSVRVILADDHNLIRAGIRALLEQLSGVAVVAEATDGRELLQLVAALQPDIVLVDIAMPELNGLEATERLTKDFPTVRVIILSMHEDGGYVWRALKAGATGYLIKKSATAELGIALQRVAVGEIYLSRELAAQLPKGFLVNGITAAKSPLEQLTGRQREVLQLIGEGQNTKRIAGILKVSPKTVEYHRAKLMECLNVRDITGLVRFAMRVGLLPQEA